jgi:hypothetical protein
LAIEAAPVVELNYSRFYFSDENLTDDEDSISSSGGLDPLNQNIAVNSDKDQTQASPRYSLRRIAAQTVFPSLVSAQITVQLTHVSYAERRIKTQKLV